MNRECLMRAAADAVDTLRPRTYRVWDELIDLETVFFSDDVLEHPPRWRRPFTYLRQRIRLVWDLLHCAFCDHDLSESDADPEAGSSHLECNRCGWSRTIYW